MKTLASVGVMLFVLICSTCLSQSLKVGVGGGPAFVQNADGRTYTSDVSNGGLGFGVAYAIGGNAKLSFPSSPIALVGRVTYVSMSGEGSLTNAGLYRQGAGSVQTGVNLWSFGVGGEWTMFRGPVAPYVGAGLLLSSFGKVSYRLTNSLGTIEYLSGGGVRGGFGFEAGAEVALTQRMHLDIRANYDLHSPFAVYSMSKFSTLGLSAGLLFTVF